MIWDQLDAQRFIAAYQVHLLSLVGAIDVATMVLRDRESARASVSEGKKALRAVSTAGRRGSIDAARSMVGEAVSLGKQHAVGMTGGSESHTHLLDQVEDIVAMITGMDVQTADSRIRNQALTYNIARQRLNHQQSLDKALGTADNSVFSQLDRANRTFKSAELALGHVRWHAADAYLNSFSLQASKTSPTALLIRQGHEPREVLLADVQALRELFHPNTPYELRPQ